MTQAASSASAASAFLLTCLLRGMTIQSNFMRTYETVSTHMPLARHDVSNCVSLPDLSVSTHMPLARHDTVAADIWYVMLSFYSHASCEA